MGCAQSSDQAAQTRRVYPIEYSSEEILPTNNVPIQSNVLQETIKSEKLITLTNTVTLMGNTQLITKPSEKNLLATHRSDVSLGNIIENKSDGIAYEASVTHQKIEEIVTTIMENALQERLKSKLNTLNWITSPQQTRRRLHNLTLNQIAKAYDQTEGNLQKFFESLDEKVSKFFMQLSLEALQRMNEHKISQKQSKVFLSEQALLLSLDILSIIGQKVDYNYDLDTFRVLNKSLGSVVRYLKTKFPRAGITFVPGDLTQNFKDFDITENPQYDILRNASIIFNQPSDIQIIAKIKQMLNKLFDELQTQFPIFQKILQEEIFIYEVDGQLKALEYKIGRKIPQNVTKFRIDDSGILNIDTPEIFRTLIKWLQYFQQWFNEGNLTQFISKKKVFKSYSQQNGQIEDQSFIRAEDVQEIHTILKQKILKLQEQFKKQLLILRNQVDIFNSNLLRILHTVERNQKFIPQKEAHVIKYVHYNMKLVSWMLVQMLVFCIRNLIKIGQQMKQTKIRSKLDLVNFKITDLMRAMVIGNKKQILCVYENIKKSQQKGLLKVLRVKSRLGTSLNDVMVIFAIKGSYLICELQLILRQGQEMSEKLKNIEFINHFLYELQRSPYGVLPEAAVVLDYNDSKIVNENKITFDTKQSIGIEVCKMIHPEMIILHEKQQKPIICNHCAKFYQPLQNIFKIEECKKCHTFQCCTCLFEKNEGLEEKSVHERFNDEIIQMIYGLDCKMDQVKVETIKEIQEIFQPEKFYLKKIFRKKHYQKLKGKDLISFFTQKMYEKLAENKTYFQGLQNKYKYLYFLLVQFKGNGTYFKILVWNKYAKIITNSFDSGETLGEKQSISMSQFDFILFFSKKGQQIQNVKLADIANRARFCLLPLDNLEKEQIVARVKLSNKSSFIVGAETEFDRQMIILNKKQFKYKSLQDARSNLPDLKYTQQSLQMKSEGITDLQLSQLQNLNIKEKLKYLNLSDNKIEHIEVIFNNCPNLIEVILSKNHIQGTVKIEKELKWLKKMNLMSNKIKNIKGLENLPNLEVLNLQFNQLEEFENQEMKNLKQLNLTKNLFTNLNFLVSENFPMLKKLLLADCGNFKNWGAELIKKVDLNIKGLKILDYSFNQTDELSISSQNLQYLNCEGNGMKSLSVKLPKIETLILKNNNIENLREVIDQNIQTIKQIQCEKAGVIGKFPIISTQKLIIFNFSDCFISNIQNISLFDSPNLEKFDLSKNSQLKQAPQLRAPNLKQLKLGGLMLQNMSVIGKDPLPMPDLKGLILTGQYDNLKLTRISYQQLCFPKLLLTGLKKLQIKYFQFNDTSQLAQSQLPNLEYLIFKGNKIIKFPTLNNLYRLKSFDASFNQLEEMYQLAQSDFPSLIYFDISNNNISRIYEPLFLKQLRMFNFFNNPFENVIDLYKYPEFMGLINLSFPQASNTFFKFKYENLKQLIIENSNFQTIKNLQYCHFPNLEQLKIINNNKLKYLPVLKFEYLKRVYIRDNSNLWNFCAISEWMCKNLEILFISDFSKGTKTILTPIGKNSLQKLQHLIIKQGILHEEKQDMLQQFDFPNLEIIELQKVSGLKSIGNKFNPKNQKIIIKQCNFIESSINLNNLTFKMVEITQCKNLQQIIQINFLETESINISQNPLLTSICKMQMSQTPKLKILKLNQNLLTDLPQSIAFEYLQILDINYNKFVSLKICHKKMPKIQQIYANSNLIEKVQPIEIKSLKLLHLNNNRLVEINFIERNTLMRLDEFSAQNNKIERISSFCSIVSINLKKNKLTSVDWYEKSSGKRLQKLDLSYNNIKSLQNPIFKTKDQTRYKMLQQLNVQFNEINQIPDITALPSLVAFYGRYNPFEDFHHILDADLEKYEKKQLEIEKQKLNKKSMNDDSEIKSGAHSLSSMKNFRIGLKVFEYSINPQLPRNQIQEIKQKMRKKLWCCSYKQY